MPIFNPILVRAGGRKPGEPLDPEQVYRDTRPAGWLPMPEPQENELYLLFHIPDGVSSLLAFTVTCTGNYTVALGTVKGGAFVQGSSVRLSSGAKYEGELFADDYGDLTGDGFKQVMVKVSGADIKTWEPSTHSKKGRSANFAGWSIVEIMCRLPVGTGVQCGNNTLNMALSALRYFNWKGANALTSAYGMFRYCSSLTAIPQLDTARVTDMREMFAICYSLTAVPQLDTAQVTNMREMFAICYSLTAVPQLDTVRVTNMYNMFRYCSSLTAIPQLDTARVTNTSLMLFGCSSLTAIPQLDTARVTDMYNMFYNCSALTAISQLDTARVTDMYDMFHNCSSLSSLLLNPAVTGWAGQPISLENCSLGHTALVKFFNSLPTITTPQAITLTGNPGVAELTDGEKAVATGKNWTLTL